MAQFEGEFMASHGGGFEDEGRPSYNARAQESNTIRSITIAQLRNGIARGGLSAEILKIDDVEASHLILCGQIMATGKQVSSIHYTINDGTGEILVKSHTPRNDELTTMQTDDEMLSKNTWCMVYGHYRSMGTDHFINAFRVRPITDHNEISFHFASCIQQYLYFTKGPLPEEEQQSQMGRYSMGNEMAPQQPYSQTQFQPGRQFAIQPAIHARIGDVLRHAKDREMHFDQICQALQAEFDPSRIETALRELSEEAKVYSASSNDRYTWSG